MGSAECGRACGEKKKPCKNCDGKSILKKRDKILRCQRCGTTGIAAIRQSSPEYGGHDGWTGPSSGTIRVQVSDTARGQSYYRVAPKGGSVPQLGRSERCR